MLQRPVSELERAQYRLAGRPPMPPVASGSGVQRVRNEPPGSKPSPARPGGRCSRRCACWSGRPGRPLSKSNPRSSYGFTRSGLGTRVVRGSRAGLVRARALLPLRARTLRGPVAVCRPLSRFPLVLTALVDAQGTAGERALEPVSTCEVACDGATQSVLDASAGATLRFRRACKDTEREHQHCGVCDKSHANLRPPPT